MAKIRYMPDPVCCRTSPTFYKVRDKTVPTHEPAVWITRSRGRATCPQDGSPIVSLSQDGFTKHICVTCLGAETQRVMAATTVEEPGTYPEQRLKCRGPRRQLA